MQNYKIEVGLYIYLYIIISQAIVSWKYPFFLTFYFLKPSLEGWNVWLSWPEYTQFKCRRQFFSSFNFRTPSSYWRLYAVLSKINPYLCYSLVIYLHNFPRKSKIKHKPETSSEIDSHTEDISKFSKTVSRSTC